MFKAGTVRNKWKYRMLSQTEKCRFCHSGPAFKLYAKRKAHDPPGKHCECWFCRVAKGPTICRTPLH